MTIPSARTTFSYLMASTAFAAARDVAPAATQVLTRYRAFVLESSPAEVVATSGARLSDLETLHSRPAHIQQLDWRAPYAGATAVDADPVRAILFSFHGGHLYQMTVSYHRERTEGLSSEDLVRAVAGTYGPPAAATLRSRTEQLTSDIVTLARWVGTAQTVTLVRGTGAPDVQLIVRSTARGALAAADSLASQKQDDADAPARRQLARDQTLVDTEAAAARNKSAFRP